MHHSTSSYNNLFSGTLLMTNQYINTPPRYLPFAEGGQILVDTLRDLVVGVINLVTVYNQRIAARRAIAEMDPRTLSDIGLSPQDAQDEAEKPFWVA